MAFRRSENGSAISACSRLEPPPMPTARPMGSTTSRSRRWRPDGPRAIAQTPHRQGGAYRTPGGARSRPPQEHLFLRSDGNDWNSLGDPEWRSESARMVRAAFGEPQQQKA
jgi:hypothetical protein